MTTCPNTHKVKIDGEWIEPESDNEDYDEYAEDYDEYAEDYDEYAEDYDEYAEDYDD